MTGLPALPSVIVVREVGPCVGLRWEAPVPVQRRAALVGGLVDAGVTTVEAAAFAPPGEVPALGGAADVMGALDRSPFARYVALVADARGAERAVEARADGVTVTVPASGADGRRLDGPVDEALAQVPAIRAAVGDDLPIDTVVACALGPPDGGDTAPAVAAAAGRRAREGGSTTLTYADTAGVATPRRIAELVDATGPDVGLRLHDGHGTALVSAYAALQLGVTRFDTSVGGLGGNLATEYLVHLCDDLGVETGIDLDALLSMSCRLADMIGHPVPSRLTACHALVRDL